MSARTADASTTVKNRCALSWEEDEKGIDAISRKEKERKHQGVPMRKHRSTPSLSTVSKITS